MEGWYTYKSKEMLYNEHSQAGHPEVLPDKTQKKRSASSDRERSGGQDPPRQKTMAEKRKKAKYTPDLARKMYQFFVGYEGAGLPSLEKFARCVGMTVDDLEGFRGHKLFDRAYRECRQIRRDYLIDRGLERRFDPSLTKFLLTLDEEEHSRENTGDIRLHLEVKE